jgi:high-affinity nickel-transport protein
MDNLPNDWLAMLALVFVLGLKHGFDADHLAVIDGLTRYNFRIAPRVARWCGMMFALGHGMVVVLIALAVGFLAGSWEVPALIGDIGVWVSIAFLLMLGVVNVHAVLSAQPDDVVQPAGVKGRFLGQLRETSNPITIMLVGALFALSFDTMSQAALFAAVGTQFGGVERALLLGLAFMLGMMATDAINGFWISRLIARADAAARLASRIMGLVVGLLSLLVAGFGVATYFSPAVDAWSNGKELVFGGAVCLVIAVSFLLAMRLTRNRRPVLVRSAR